MHTSVTRVSATALVLGAALIAGVVEPSAQVETRTLRFTAASNKGHPQVLGVEKFAELVRTRAVARSRSGLSRVDPSGRTCRWSPPCRVARST
jgi:TRAP-type C4-dicarboxylate transport system substrate-binding protein